MTIRQEADSEPFAGKVAVAEVIRNRMMTNYHSDGTVEGTVLAPFQFSGWNTQDPNRRRVASLDDADFRTLEAFRAWRTAMEHNTDLAKGANLYHSVKVVPAWATAPTVKQTTQIGNHVFYKDQK
jgi:spore germination cell wall hydrolase CwlJ-like protein